MHTVPPVFSDQQIIALRPARNRVDPGHPYACMVEQECAADQSLQSVVTIFLTSNECVFHCTMCDLWKNTLPRDKVVSSIPQQIRWALKQKQIDPRAPEQQGVTAIKLYNSGNFFDPHSVPPSDWPEIADLVKGFTTVIVENHPTLCGDACFDFQNMLSGQLEIALGLESIHPRILPWLNKHMTLEDFQTATSKLVARGIRIRTFILLRPPFLTEDEGMDWAIRAMEFAFDCGVECCSLVPTRSGNGVMDQLERDGLFTPPQLKSMEMVQRAGLEMKRGRVLMDLWDADQFSMCPHCVSQRVARLTEMNHTQIIRPGVVCRECS